MVTTVGNVPDKEGKRFDPNCDPNNPLLDAKAGAPPAGTWFHAQARPPPAQLPTMQRGIDYVDSFVLLVLRAWVATTKQPKGRSA